MLNTRNRIAHVFKYIIFVKRNITLVHRGGKHNILRNKNSIFFFLLDLQLLDVLTDEILSYTQMII